MWKWKLTAILGLVCGIGGAGWGYAQQKKAPGFFELRVYTAQQTRCARGALRQSYDRDLCQARDHRGRDRFPTKCTYFVALNETLPLDPGAFPTANDPTSPQCASPAGSLTG